MRTLSRFAFFLICALAVFACSQPLLTIEASPSRLVKPGPVHFVAAYFGATEPARIEWALCRTREGADITAWSEIRPLRFGTLDYCMTTCMSEVTVRGADGHVLGHAAMKVMVGQ